MISPALVLSALLLVEPPTQAPKLDAPPPKPTVPDLAGTWQVTVRPGDYDGCGLKEEVLASQWLVSQTGRELSIRISTSSGADFTVDAVVDRSRVILLSETSVQLAVVPPEDKAGWANALGVAGSRRAREQWVLSIGDGVLKGTRSLIVEQKRVEQKRDADRVRWCLVEQDVAAKRL